MSRPDRSGSPSGWTRCPGRRSGSARRRRRWGSCAMVLAVPPASPIAAMAAPAAAMSVGPATASAWAMIPFGCGLPGAVQQAEIQVPAQAVGQCAGHPGRDVTRRVGQHFRADRQRPVTFATATIRASSLSTRLGTSWSSSSQAYPVGATVGNASLPVAVWALVRLAANGRALDQRIQQRPDLGGGEATGERSGDDAGRVGGVMAWPFSGQGWACASSAPGPAGRPGQLAKAGRGSACHQGAAMATS